MIAGRYLHESVATKKWTLAFAKSLPRGSLSRPGVSYRLCLAYHYGDSVAELIVRSMKHRRGSRRRNLSVCAAAFGAVFIYCLYGAVQSHLAIPVRYRHGLSILAGPAAWTFLLGIVCLWLGVSIRIGLFSFRNQRARLIIARTLLFLGIAGLTGAGFLPTVTRVS